MATKAKAPASLTPHVALDRALHEIARHLDEKLMDSRLTARIIGEMSAGKSTLLRTLLAELVPSDLLPRAALQRETLVPLEVTYGPKAALWEIERACDAADGRPLRQLEQFPSRKEMQASPAPPDRRLRLQVPLEQLRLPSDPVSGDESGPARLFLIDTPGWNSGDRDVSHTRVERDVVLVALVYVVSATRLAGSENLAELRAVVREMAAIANGEDDRCFWGEPQLMVYVTRWEDSPTSEADQAEYRTMLAELLAAEGLGDLAERLAPRFVNFDRLDEAGRAAFRTQFWDDLFLGWRPEAAAARNWTHRLALAELQPRLNDLLAAVRWREALVGKFADGTQLIPMLNMERLRPMPQEMATRLRDHWVKHLAMPVMRESRSYELPTAHPLAAWWNQVVLPDFLAGQDTVDALVAAMFDAFPRVTVETKELEDFLRAAIAEPLVAARRSLYAAQECFPPSLRELIDAEASPVGHVVATMIAISLIRHALDPHRA